MIFDIFIKNNSDSTHRRHGEVRHVPSTREIERAVKWKNGSRLHELAGQTIRLRCVMKDADLYSIRFGDPKTN